MLKLSICGILLIIHTFWARYWRIRLATNKTFSNSIIALLGSLSLLITGLYGFYSESPISVLYAIAGMYLFRYVFIPINIQPE